MTIMKKMFIVLLAATCFTACGGGNSASKLANEVCDCSKKANAMDAADPKRTEAQNDCAKKQGEAWDKVKDDQKKSDEFNKIIGDCSKEMIKKSFSN
jgi:hypothetical protein